MKLEFWNTVEALKKCISLSDSLHDLSAVLKYIDTLISIKEFPNSTTTERITGMEILLDAYFKKHDTILVAFDEEEIDIKALQIHPQ